MVTVLFCIRYSVVTKTSKNSFVSGRDCTDDEYKAKIFDKKRLEVHQRLFEKVCIPSIDGQVLDNKHIKIKVLVITSQELPSEQMLALDNLQKKYGYLDVLKVSFAANVSESINSYIRDKNINAANYCTVRIDDDDGVSKYFSNNLARYITSSNNNFVVSQSNGYTCWYDQDKNKITEGYHSFNIKVSAGMAFVKTDGGVDNIYNVGNHTKVDRHYPLIVDSRIVAYLNNRYDFQDTAGLSYKSREKSNFSRDVPRIKECFSIDLGLFD